MKRTNYTEKLEIIFLSVFECLDNSVIEQIKFFYLALNQHW